MERYLCTYEQHQQRWHFPNADMTILIYVTEGTGYSTFNPSGVHQRYSPLAHSNQVVAEKMASRSRLVATKLPLTITHSRAITLTFFLFSASRASLPNLGA